MTKSQALPTNKYRQQKLALLTGLLLIFSLLVLIILMHGFYKFGQPGLKLIRLWPTWRQIVSGPLEASNLTPQLVDQTTTTLTEVSQSWPDSWVWRRFAPETAQQFINYWHNHDRVLTDLIHHYLLEPHKVLVLFQNSAELRASGGFMGSYAIINYRPSEQLNFEVEDIYDADGQFSGYVAAPPGVKEYLSSDRGMRLPDSNWSPDFSISASQVLEYFALGDRSGIDTVIAINHPVLEKVMRVLGPISLPDYNTTVRAENVTQFLQNRPDLFFPGSQRKKHQISQLLNQVLIKMESLNQNQWLALATLAPQLLHQKELQFFSNHPETQALLAELNLTGEFLPPSEADAIAWIESNVGINKVNSNISREMSIEMSQYQVEILADFDNAGEEQYVNYQRVIVPNSWQINTIGTTKQDQLKYDLNSINFHSADHTWQEIGFLLVVPQHQKLSVSLVFSRNLDSPADSPPLYIFKQSGLPPTPIHVLTPHSKSDWLLETDLLIR